MAEKKALEGAFTPPPPDAPQQVTLAGSERATPEQIAAARANERELAPFAPKPMTPAQIKALIGKDVSTIVETPSPRVQTSSIKPVDQPLTSKLRRVVRPAVATEAQKPVEPPMIVLTDADRSTVTVEVDPLTSPMTPRTTAVITEIEDPTASAPEPAPLPPPLPHQKAASDTDTPSRGIPTAIADPNKQITGGFGVPGEGPADYFPLDGTELRAVVERLLTDLHTRIQDDLRFSIACTYPRVSARVEIVIDAYGMDKPMVIPRVAKPHDKTALESARQHAQEICFVVNAEVVEMTSEGQSITPPNQMRLDVGLEVPHKQAVQTPSGARIWIDRST